MPTPAPSLPCTVWPGGASAVSALVQSCPKSFWCLHPVAASGPYPGWFAFRMAKRDFGAHVRSGNIWQYDDFSKGSARLRGA